MANNFFNAIKINVSNDSTLPTAVYTTPASKKSILIELDVANKSSSGVTVTVQICDASANSSGTSVLFSNADGSTNYSVKYLSPGDTLLDFGSTQGFAAAMAVALGWLKDYKYNKNFGVNNGQ